MNYTIKSPETESEWESYFNFRWEKLRKPLGMPKDTLKDDKEQDSCHLIAVDSVFVPNGTTNTITIEGVFRD